MKRKVLIVDAVHPLLIDKLSSRNFTCEVIKDIDKEGFIDLPDVYDGLIIRSKFKVDEKAIASKKQLKFILRIGSGMENIDVEYAELHGIYCLHTPEGNAESVAQHCLALLLCALRNISNANAEVRKGKWLREANKGTEITSHTYGIIGYGHTGKAFAKLLKQFGAKVYMYDRYSVGFDDDDVIETSIENLMKECDVVSLHVNYTPDNYYFFNNQIINYSEKPFILLNTSRGLVVNTHDLISNLLSGHIKYACLDVLEYENTQLQNLPMSNWNEDMTKLAHLSQVILTPHIAGQTLEAEKRHAEIAFSKICSLITNW